MNDTNKQLPATTKASPQPSPARLWPLWLVILVLALGLTYMNTARFSEALDILTPIQDRPEAGYYIQECRKKLK